MEASQPCSRPNVAFLGPFTSYSHQATGPCSVSKNGNLAHNDDQRLLCKAPFLFPESDTLYLVSKERTLTSTPPTTHTGTLEVFDVVQAGQASYGVVPFENSTHGTVTFTLDGLADRQHAYTDLHVCGEIYLDVHHFLLGRRAPGDSSGGSGGSGGSNDDAPRGTPLTGLAHVQRVYSHPQALGQSAAFLARHLRGVETVEVSSTSKAAELVARDAEGASAAVAGEMAAAAHGLDVLARCIEDREDNTTRFFVIGRGEGGQDGRPRLPGTLLVGKTATGAGGSGTGTSGKRSLVSFTVPHRSPGALADVLECFRKSGLNLTSINSVPSLVRPFQYLFFVEFEGSKLDDPDGRVKSALDDVAKVAQSCRWLGSWVDQRR